MPRAPQSGPRKSPAPSTRQHGLRSLSLLNPRNGSFLELTDSFDARPSEKQKHSVAQTFELSLTEEKQNTIERTALDSASIRSLRSMFLLLDEWDRASPPATQEDSSSKCEILIDTKTN